MKKIILSLAIIAVVGAIVVGATTAFFSDTETSTGNTFTAGAIDLKIDNTCHYNGGECVCNNDNVCTWNGGPYNGEPCSCTWLSKDLDGDVFFNFNDVKPGDYGEDTISFDLTSNPAWACVYVENIVDTDNTCVEPEVEAEGSDCAPTNDGELDENLHITAWLETDCDNVLDSGEEIIVDNKLLSNYIDGQTSFVIPVADNSDDSLRGNGVPLPQGHYCVGIAWCLGTVKADGSCDGTNVGNEVQTDKVGANLKFYVEQARNNSGFTCVGN